jgi:hypothetical protein
MTDDEILALWRAPYDDGGSLNVCTFARAIADRAAEDEREACARVAATYGTGTYVGGHIAELIRARGTEGPA